jgi:hypothetical protein
MVIAGTKASQSTVRSWRARLRTSPAGEPANRMGVTGVSWFWMFLPLGAVFFFATAGIPMWLVLTRPDFAHEPAGRTGRKPGQAAAAGQLVTSRH